MLNTLSLVEARDQLRRGTCSSEELVQSVLEAICERDGAIEAYTLVNEEEALAAAREADAQRRAGKERELLGIPIGIKDLINVKGQPCTCSSNILEGYTSPYDATVIARLREQGAIMLGRLNMDEFAMGSSTETSAMMKTRNPHDPSKVPGGSSGGSAAAVAADMAIATLGSDTGGSIRQPAAFCGCVGVKPSYGRVSRYGLTAFASSLDQIGPMTKTVEDAGLLLNAISGQDDRDSTSLEAPPVDLQACLKNDLKGVRIGIPKEYFIDGIDEEVERAVRAAIEACEALGAELIDVSLPHTSYAIATYYIIATAEASANLARFEGMRYGARVEGKDPIDMYGKTRAAGFGTEVKRRIILGTYVLSSGYYDAYYGRAQKVRTLIRRDFEQAFEQVDALLTPTTPTAAYGIGENIQDPLKMYLGDIFTANANIAGICGISVPCGKTSSGLPIGLQVLGPAFKEENILRVAYAYEQSRGEA